MTAEPPGLAEIWFHDSKICRVVENPEADELGLEVMYPVDWDANEFAPRTIVFCDVLEYAVVEGPFLGRPTILDVEVAGTDGERWSVRLNTNAGVRTLSCGAVTLRPRWNMV